jgi:hypothetical protein
VAITTPSDAQAVARDLALAMRDPAIRRQVHRAMRASRFNEHKLVLQDVINTPDGANLFNAADKRTIASLPALDFYLPFQSHRQSWKPKADVYVAVTFDPDASAITAYGTNGQTLTLRKPYGIPAVPLIILHPAEPKSTRSDLLAKSDEDLIEGPTVTASSSIMSSPVGPAFYILPGGGGGSGGGGTAPGTYINHFNIKADDGLFGSSEMRFFSYAVAGWQFVDGNNGTSHFLVANHICDKGLYSRDGVDNSGGYDGLWMISPTVTRNSFLSCDGVQAQYAIHIVEVDGDLNGNNDDYGWRFYAAGGYPSGALYDPYVNSFYAETFPPNDYTRTAYLRIEIH